MLHLISVKYLCSLFGLEVAQQQLIYRNLFRSCFDSKYERFFLLYSTLYKCLHIQNALVLSWLEINLFDRTQRKSEEKKHNNYTVLICRFY